MSSPADRLLGDQAAERLHLEALAVLSGPEVMPALTALAAGVVALARDRQARVEMVAFLEKA